MNPKYSLLILRSYSECSPGGTDTKIEGICIQNGHSGKEEFVILDVSSTFMHPPRYESCFYASEAEMTEAFWRGLMAIRNPPEAASEGSTMKDVLAFLSSPSVFEGHPGFLRKSLCDDWEKKPWFLAEEGEREEGDIVFSTSEETPRSS